MTARRRTATWVAFCLVMIDAFGRAQQPVAGVTVSGTVSLPDGSPVQNAQMTLAGGTPLREFSAVTDASGAYQFGNVPAGGYQFVVIHPAHGVLVVGKSRPNDAGTRPFEVGAVDVRKNIVIASGAVITGRITDERGRPIPDVKVSTLEVQYVDGQLMRWPGVATSIRPTDALGEYRIAGLLPGRYYVRAASPVRWPDTDSARTLAFPLTYYPGVAFDAAQPIDIGSGDTVELSFAMIPAPVTHVAGRLTRADGAPIAESAVQLQYAEPGSPGVWTVGVGHASTKTAADGSFDITSVPSGDFLLTTGSASRFISVPPGGLTGISLVARPGGGTIRGAIVTDRGERPAFPAAGVSIALIAAIDDETISSRAPAGRINPDWSFFLTAVRQPRLLRLDGLPPDYALRAVLHGAEDITDRLVEVSEQDPPLEDVRIVVTQSTGRVSGRIMRGTNAPAAETLVVIFAEDPAAWGLGSRFVRSAYTDARGGFELRGLLAGTYRVLAPHQILPGQWQNADYLRSVAGTARRVTVQAGQAVSNLQLSVAP